METGRKGEKKERALHRGTGGSSNKPGKNSMKILEGQPKK